MQRSNLIFETLLAGVILVLVFLLADFFNFWMPNAVHMLILALLIVVVAIFTVFIWYESVRDERELMHRSVAGRVSFLVGTVVLTVGIVTQSYAHELDLWLVYALVAMVLSKIISQAYGRSRY